jgi:hypothetical protein
MQDVKNEVAVVHLLDTQDIADTTTASSILDTAGFEGAIIAVNIGAITTPNATNYLTPVLQESATTANGDFTAVAAGSIEGAFTKIDATTEDQVTQYVGYAGSKRYIRVNLEVTDPSPSSISACLISVDGILTKGSYVPVTAPAAITAT